MLDKAIVLFAFPSEYIRLMPKSRAIPDEEKSEIVITAFLSHFYFTSMKCDVIKKLLVCM